MPVRFVEYDETGELTHVCEVFTAEGPDAPPPVVEPAAEPTDPDERAAGRRDRDARRQARATRVAELIAAAEQRTRDQLTAVAKTRRLVVLDPAAELPVIGQHVVDVRTRQLRRLTPAELTARGKTTTAAPAATP